MRRLILALLLGAACYRVSLSPEAEAVRLTPNPEVVRGCESLGTVAGSDNWHGGVFSGRAEENASRRLRNDAAKLGGNVVLMLSSSTGWTGSRQRGEVYRCPTASPPADPA